MRISVVRLDPDLELPRPARPGDAGLDLRSRIDVTIPAAGGRALVPTGIAVAVPEGFAGLVLPRSGLATRHGVTCTNAPGLIDPGYRGELLVPLLNTDPTDAFEVRRGDRIAQLVVQAVVVPELVEVTSLDGTERGAGGHGSTGVG